jgi:hypothetical protein
MKSGSQPETKRANKEWSHSSSPKLKEFHLQASVGKMMLMLFFDHKGPLLEHNISKGTAVTSVSYCIILRNHLRPAISSECCGPLNTGILLLHDNARPHTACVSAETIREVHFECHPHLPYLPGFAPYDYHVFGLLEERLFDLMKKWKRWCTIGYSCSQRIFSQGIWALVKG